MTGAHTASEEGLPEADYTEVLELIGEAENKASSLEGQDRSIIAKRVVWLYMGAVLICLVFVFATFLSVCPNQGSGQCVAWKEPADFMLQILTTAVLPIVTLVLGYYFGTAKNDG